MANFQTIELAGQFIIEELILVTTAGLKVNLIRSLKRKLSRGKTYKLEKSGRKKLLNDD